MAFDFGDVAVEGPATESAAPTGVRRWHCAACGSPLTASFDYLPGQIYVPLGLFDAADALAPRLRSHADAMLPWLHLSDDLPREGGSARAGLTP